MSITNGYCTLADLRKRLGISSEADTADDATLEAVITAVSRGIDQFTGRRFYTTAQDETHYYTAHEPGVLFTADILSITTLATDDADNRTYSTTWATTDYDLWPDGAPFTMIYTRPDGAYSFPITRRGVKIVGKFGYSSTTPDRVREATLLQSERIFKRKDAPFGLTGSPEFGTLQVIPKLDPDVQWLLSGLMRLV